MSILAETFAAELRRVIADRHLSKAEAARQLGLSRQAIYNYLNGIAVPRDKIIDRAMAIWDLKMTIGMITYDRSSFSDVAKPQVVPKQLDLWEKLGAIRQEDLGITVKRVGNAYAVSLEITIPA